VIDLTIIKDPDWIKKREELWKPISKMLSEDLRKKDLEKVTQNNTSFYKLVEKRPDIKIDSKQSFQNITFGNDSAANVSPSTHIKTSGSSDVISFLVNYGFDELKDLGIDEPGD
jgi:hypothetical protein